MGNSRDRVGYVLVSDLELNLYRVTLDGVEIGPIYSRFVTARMSRWLAQSLDDMEPLIKKPVRKKKETKVGPPRLFSSERLLGR
jgi:hypothetical protein